MFYRFSPKNNNRTVSKQAQNFLKTCVKQSRSSNQEENARNYQVFTLEDEENSKKLLLQALKTHLQNHFKVSFPWKLGGT